MRASSLTQPRTTHPRKAWLVTAAITPALCFAAFVATAPASVALGSQAGTATSRVASPVRAFSDASWWNIPLGSAPVDPRSAAYIQDSQSAAHTQNYVNLTVGNWGMPIYQAVSTDPLYTINPSSSGPTVVIHIPAAATQQPTSDGEIAIVDPSTNQSVGLWKASFNSATHRWASAGASRYLLSSTGIQQSLPGGTPGNDGHRGVPSAVRAVQKSEITSGAINHRLEIYWWATAGRTPQGASAYFPMNSSEQGKGGIVPEGIVVRIKPSVNLATKGLSPAALVIATALQKYGAVVGDNSGSGNNLKVQSNADWSGVLNATSLKSLSWNDYEFVRGGFTP
jgi:hypothetical protein